MLRFAICDDCKTDREEIGKYLNGFFLARNQEISITEYEDGTALSDDYRDGEAMYEMIFLDIFMMHSQGMNIARDIRKYDTKVKIVFATVSTDFAVDSYEVQAFHYILKPVNPEKFTLLIQRFLKEMFADRKQSLLVKNSRRQERISYKDILYIESQNTSIYVHTVDGTVYRLYGKLKDYEEELAGKGFIRCHQSYIVNLKHVRSVEQKFVLNDGTQIPIRRQEVKAMREIYYEYVIETTI